jgi:hypothetical protein
MHQPPCQAQALCQCPLAFRPSSTFTAKHATTTSTKDHIDQPTNPQTIHPTSWINRFKIASCKTGFHIHTHCHIHIHTHALTLTHASCTSALATSVLDQIAASSFDEPQLHQSFGTCVSIILWSKLNLDCAFSLTLDFRVEVMLALSLWG